MDTLLQVVNNIYLLASCYSKLHIIAGGSNEVPQENAAKNGINIIRL